MRLFNLLERRVRGTAAVERRFLRIITEGLLREIALEEEPMLLSAGRAAGAVRVTAAKVRQDRR